MVMDTAAEDLVQKGLKKFKPLLWLRDGRNVKRIKQARTAEELLDLLPLATGLADSAWQEQVRQFGPEVLPLISERLKMLRPAQDQAKQDMTVEKLIAALRWRGEAGGQVLLERFDDLNLYGRSLACVVLGLVGMRSSADTMWTFYHKAVRNRGQSYFVGALWGLIDLHDERAGEALADLLRQRHYFYELFGFLSLAGDARAVSPLLQELQRRPDEQRMDPLMALLSISHRLGREALRAELAKVASPPETPASHEAVVEAILSKPADYAQAHFQLFYRGLNTADVAQLIPGED
jgi:hypothetical protein